MKPLKVLINVAVFCVTWMVVRRLFGETTFTAGDAVAMVVAGVSTALATVWREKRKARSAAGV